MHIEKGYLVYIPTGESYLGGLAEVLMIQDDIVVTEFDNFTKNFLEKNEEAFQKIFSDQMAQWW